MLLDQGAFAEDRGGRLATSEDERANRLMPEPKGRRVRLARVSASSLFSSIHLHVENERRCRSLKYLINHKRAVGPNFNYVK